MNRIATGHPDDVRIAYFSMEIGLDSALPTYSGGLGVLAGDTLKAAADLGLPMAGITLLHRKGYFRQKLDGDGNQTEGPVDWHPEQTLEPMSVRASIRIQGRDVRLKAWRRIIRGASGGEVPVYFIDSDLAENHPDDRALTFHLYGGDARYRLCQEAVLGFGGTALLAALGHGQLETLHMNEGHAAFATIAALKERMGSQGLAAARASDLDAVRERCVFTTHTPVPAGHDQFPGELVRAVLNEDAETIEKLGCCHKGGLNMTYLALFLSRFVNGVAMRHGQISNDMFPGYPIEAITNGVHAATWISRPFRSLFDRFIPQWRAENLYLRYAVGIPLEEIHKAHAQSKRSLLSEIERRSGRRLSENTLTIGFARRATPYKRADLVFSDLERLRVIARRAGPMQFIFAGKAHPNDEAGKAMIRSVFQVSRALGNAVPVVYLEEYDMDLGARLTAGCDIWLNTPRKPQEASGTSGMKAAMNGVPSLSVLDGWWIEGHVEGVTGWSIGETWRTASDSAEESASLYCKLEHTILPLYRGEPRGFDAVRRRAIALNGSFYNAQRMVSQYAVNAYRMRIAGVAAKPAPVPVGAA